MDYDYQEDQYLTVILSEKMWRRLDAAACAAGISLNDLVLQGCLHVLAEWEDGAPPSPSKREKSRPVD